jgi:hypothetical protein
MIICAAIKITMNNVAGTSRVICGHRHGDCFQTITMLNDNWRFCKREEGFITNTGDFLNRKDALKHATNCGQLSQSTLWYKEDNKIEELESEDLY